MIETRLAQALLDAARGAASRAYAPYSDFAVGAAVLDASGGIWVGCNVENASYGLTMCAERCAVFGAVAGGARRLSALAVAGPAGRPCPPCGACLQVLSEFAAPDCDVVLDDGGGSPRVSALAELLPQAFRLGREGC